MPVITSFIKITPFCLSETAFFFGGGGDFLQKNGKITIIEKF
jgi:hypothetical protein